MKITRKIPHCLKTKQRTCQYSPIKKKTFGVQTGRVQSGQGDGRKWHSTSHGLVAVFTSQGTYGVCWGRHKMSASPQPAPRVLKFIWRPYLGSLTDTVPRGSTALFFQGCNLENGSHPKTVGGTKSPRAAEEGLEAAIAQVPLPGQPSEAPDW